MHFDPAVPNPSELIRQARTLAKESNRRAVESLARALPLLAAPVRDEAYYAEELNYLIGLVCAYANDAAGADRAIGEAGMRPFGGGAPLFEFAAAEGAKIAEAQEAAIAKGVPAFLLSCMPRAASAALTQTLSQVAGAPRLRISLGAFPDDIVISSWLDAALRGGCVLHDHFGAGEHNLARLHERGVTGVSVLVRDPRAAALSLTAHLRREQTADNLMRTFVEEYVPWMRRWAEADIDVHWIRSADVTGTGDSLHAVLDGLFRRAGATLPPDIAQDVDLVRANFGHGDDERWREYVPGEDRRRMFDMIPPPIRDSLNLEP